MSQDTSRKYYLSRPSLYRDSKRALEEVLRQDARSMIDTRKGRRSFDQWSVERTKWRGNRCGLCRFVQKSSKSFSADDRGICLSCFMRGNRPRWLSVEGGMVEKWRGQLTQKRFAGLAGWKQPHQARFELPRKRRVNGSTARRLATAVVLSANLGNDLRAVMSTWPLFPLLADQDTVEAFLRGEEYAGEIKSALLALEQDETDELYGRDADKSS